MSNSQITEVALRSAVNQYLNSGSTQESVTALKAFAKSKAENLVLATADSETSQSQINLQGAAIDLALKGVVLAVSAVASQISNMKGMRLSFDNERSAGVAFFSIPKGKEEKDLSEEEKIIKAFIAYEKSETLARYLTIKKNNEQDSEVDFYSVLPYYKMSQSVHQPVSSPNKLDRVKVNMGLFFKSALPEIIADIDHEFTEESDFAAFFHFSWEKDNYLNNLRAPRFIMMSLANMLWNLQNPVDEEGIPVSLSRQIDLCQEAYLFVNALLNESTQPKVHLLSSKEIKIKSLLRQVEAQVVDLRDAIIDERINSMNVAEVTNSAHRSLRVMAKSIFKLIYRRKEGADDDSVPDDRAAQDIAHMFIRLNRLIEKDSSNKLLTAFAGVVDLSAEPNGAFLNLRVSTVIDLLIIFIHASPTRRATIFKNLDGFDSDSARELKEVLQDFDDKFVEPIREQSEAALDLPFFTKHKNSQIAKHAAQRLIPLVTLILKDYRIPVTTKMSSLRATLEDEFHSKIIDGDAQLDLINHTADQGGGHYQWRISDFIRSTKDFSDEINLLPKKLFRLTKISELLDSLRDLTEHYKSFLAYPSFQSFLLKCIADVRREYSDLDSYVEKLDSSLKDDELVSRDFKAILLPMTADIESTAQEFESAAQLLKKRVSSPEFTVDQKKILQKKLNDLNKQYGELFPGQQTGIEQLIEISDNIPKAKEKGQSSHNQKISNEEAIAINALLQNCLNSMSEYMRWSYKSNLLQNLIDEFSHKPNSTKQDVKNILHQLTRVVLAYRNSFFFTASYGETKSAKALAKALFDSLNSSSYLLIDYIFEDDDVVDFSSEQGILDGLKALGNKKQWAQQEYQLAESSPVTAVSAMI